MVYYGEIGGVPLAVTHSHIDGKVMELVQLKRYEWIFHGHTHRKRDEIIKGVRIVNPGALGGLGTHFAGPFYKTQNPTTAVPSGWKDPRRTTKRRFHRCGALSTMSMKLWFETAQKKPSLRWVTSRVNY